MTFQNRFNCFYITQKSYNKEASTRLLDLQCQDVEHVIPLYPEPHYIVDRRIHRDVENKLPHVLNKVLNTQPSIINITDAEKQ